ncbi:2-carboxy-1,4-naphthoquinone phytyltransferase [Pantanalinema sp. GBBB05]|uniref:2-carboxy-1,4-naphthoquinone phytyltransferase n=1 Tax=Pantanalinema sp. GBBB05 TaxID=2604139 RepID=UPI001DCC2414|nr:2-carboxy-1,4-naphthoquinone phytyltransferase [Pantanalinema sp. GBBB05]
MTTKTVQPSTTLTPDRKRLWLAAIKPPMYSVAIMPIWVGSAIAVYEMGQFHSGIFALFLTAAVLILAWENLSNDVFDSETGVDVNKAHSLVNLTGNQRLIFWIGNFCLMTGLLGIGAIAAIQHDFTVIGLILLCCGFGYLYQGPPFRLGYYGLGEILCFFAFGPIGFAATYYSQAQAWSGLGANLAASVIVGISTSLVLFCSHFHQVEDDAAVGKRSPIVRLGTERGAQVLTWFSISIYGLTGLFIGLQLFPLWTLLVFASLPAAIKLIRHVNTHHDDPDRISNSKFVAIEMHFWSGLLLGLGFLLPGLLG